MTTALYYESPTAPTLTLTQLEQRLQLPRGCTVAVLNAPLESGLQLLANSRANPYDADIVIAFATRRRDLALVKAAYSAAHSGRQGWIVYPEPGQPGTDLRWDWFVAALRQYGLHAVPQEPIDRSWSVVLLEPIRHDDRDAMDGGVKSPAPQ